MSHACPLCGAATNGSGIKVNVPSNLALFDGRPIRFSARQTELLHVMVEEWPMPVKRDRLFARVWGHNSDVHPHIVPVIVSGINQKIADTGYTIIGKRGRSEGYTIRKTATVQVHQ